MKAVSTYYKKMLTLTRELNLALQENDFEKVISLTRDRESIFSQLYEKTERVSEKVRGDVEKILIMENRIMHLLDEKKEMIKKSFFQLHEEQKIAEIYCK